MFNRFIKLAVRIIKPPHFEFFIITTKLWLAKHVVGLPLKAYLVVHLAHPDGEVSPTLELGGTLDKVPSKVLSARAAGVRLREGVHQGEVSVLVFLGRPFGVAHRQSVQVRPGLVAELLDVQGALCCFFC